MLSLRSLNRRNAALARLFSTDSSSIVPIISLEPFYESEAGKKQVAQQIQDACVNIGFFVIRGHKVPDDVLAAGWDSTRRFFDLSVEAKNKYITKDENEYPYGYVGFGKEILSAGKDAEEGRGDAHAAPDLKECFSIGPYNPAAGMPAIRWPCPPEDMEETWLAYYKEMERLSADLLRGFALALELPENWFEDKIDRHRCSMRALNYPEQDKPPMPGQLRASAHTDYGSLTILKPDDAPGGLEVMDRKGQWHAVPYIQDGFVINLGDLMSRWTNDQWVSTLHRVVNPHTDPPPTRSTRRQSIAFFHNINADTVVDCIPTCVGAGKKYPPITAFDHLMEKHLASVGGATHDEE